jgi:hypothetical protein
MNGEVWSAFGDGNFNHPSLKALLRAENLVVGDTVFSAMSSPFPLKSLVNVAILWTSAKSTGKHISSKRNNFVI